MATIAQAYVQILPSAEGIQGSLTNLLGGETEAAGNSAGNSFGSNMIGAIKGIIAAAGIGAMIKESLDQGAALQQSMGGIETLFKDSADTVKGYAAEAYKTAGLSANEYMESVTGFSASLLQGLGGDTAKAAEVANMALIDMSDNANKMGSDMSGIQTAYQGFAKQNYTMLDNLKLGYGGTKGEMQRLLADAEKISGVHYDLDNLADVYNAIHVIQGELDITGTTAKEASVTFSGSMAAMKSAFTNLLGDLALGNDLGPALSALTDTVMTFVNQNLLPMVGQLISGVPDMVSGILSAIIGELNALAGNADQFVETAISFVTNLGSAIISAVPYLLEAAVNLVMAIGDALIHADWIGIITDMVTEIKDNMDVAAGEILGTDGSIIDSVLQAITDNLPGVLESGMEIVMNIVNGILDNMPQIITTAGQLVIKLVTAIAENLPTVIQSGTKLVLTIVDSILKHLPDIASAAARVVGQLARTVVENLPKILATGVEMMVKLTGGFLKAIPQLLAAVPKVFVELVSAFSGVNWMDIGVNIMKGIAEGIRNAVSYIVNAAKDAASGAVSALKGALGIHSPSTVMRDQVGRWIPEGIAAGIEGNMNPITSSMDSIMNEMALGENDTIKMAASATGTFSLAPAGGESAAPGSIVINVYASPEQDESLIAEMVDRKLAQRYQRKGAVFA